MTTNQKRLLVVAVFLQCVCAAPSMAARQAFAEYWVPQSDGEKIFSFYIGKREIGPGKFAVTYGNLDIDKGQKSSWKSKATVDCVGNAILDDGRDIKINPDDKDASMATITAQNLWWLVCRGTARKYSPHGL